ncbi:MAG TPA: sigma-70 family RNA polymerase sigma factor, partial [Saprospiraceae bacterium]|nr:sigma-70 family RNA polymerase sigma factor [Saprospiraceae bacterium]
IALNVALSQVRRSRPPTSVLSPQLHHLHDDPPQQDHLEPLYAAMQMLSDVEKALLLLYFEDNSTEQIADLTGITPNHVRVKLHRIREKLKHHLSHHLSHP